jgi:hypothetical protein
MALEVQKYFDVYRKSTRKYKKKQADKIDYDVDSGIRSFKRYKAKKEFESGITDEIKEVEEESEAQKKFKRDDGDDTEDDEEIIIIEYRPDPLTVINTPHQDNVHPIDTQPVVKHRRILRDDN